MTELRRATGLVAVLRAVHERPGIERAAVARETGMTSGFVTETVARLRALDLVTERPAPPTGGRGRPTTTIHPHPRGPLVVAAAVGHETWKLAVTQLGGTELVRADRAHRRDPDQVLDELGAALRSVRGRYRRRIRSVAVSVPGTVVDNHLAQAANLGWEDIDLGVLWPARAGRPGHSGWQRRLLCCHRRSASRRSGGRRVGPALVHGRWHRRWLHRRRPTCSWRYRHRRRVWPYALR